MTSSLQHQGGAEHDTELELALRISLEEERRKQEQQVTEENATSEDSLNDEEDLLQKALFLSQNEKAYLLSFIRFAICALFTIIFSSFDLLYLSSHDIVDLSFPGFIIDFSITASLLLTTFSI